jgi:hypothetical protein
MPRDDADPRFDLARAPARRFESRTVRVPPGGEQPLVAGEWRDALIVVREGEVELETRSGCRLRLVLGDVACFEGLSIRLLRNPGAVPAVLDTVRRRPTDEPNPRRGSDP